MASACPSASAAILPDSWSSLFSAAGLADQELLILLHASGTGWWAGDTGFCSMRNPIER